jgi:hypothetical protein
MPVHSSSRLLNIRRWTLKNKRPPGQLAGHFNPNAVFDAKA